MGFFQRQSLIEFYDTKTVVDGLNLEISFLEFLNDFDQQRVVFSHCKGSVVNLRFDTTICYLQKTVWHGILVWKRYRLGDDHAAGIQRVFAQHHKAIKQRTYHRFHILDKLSWTREQALYYVALCACVVSLLVYVWIGVMLHQNQQSIAHMTQEIQSLQDQQRLHIHQLEPQWERQVREMFHALTQLSQLPMKLDTATLSPRQWSLNGYVHQSQVEAWQSGLASLAQRAHLQGAMIQKGVQGAWTQWEGRYDRVD